MKNELELAQLCAEAYAEVDCTIGHLQFIVRTTATARYVAVRGTDFCYQDGNWRDLVRNIRTVPWRHRATGFAHAGYLKGAICLYEHLLKDCHHGLFDRPVVVTGHSMGAAVGSLLTQMIEADGHHVARLVLFGSPRVYVFRTPQFKCDVLHLRNGSDIVTGVHPMYKLPAPFIQIGDRVKAWNVFDHSISEYIRVLNTDSRIESGFYPDSARLDPITEKTRGLHQ